MSNIDSVPMIVDIEDLANVKHGCACPYYLAREIEPIAEVVFMPYNYVIDPLIRKTLSVDLTRYGKVL